MWLQVVFTNTKKAGCWVQNPLVLLERKEAIERWYPLNYPYQPCKARPFCKTNRESELMVCTSQSVFCLLPLPS